ncbi:MAG TPA: preprotein translocase subunit SecG [Anaeromyxobacteraceae bacterium]|nr:preprotein translocase subunit SecG [Anaeromyxobacteraceae bacterium]
MNTLVTILHILVCVVLILVILLQAGKGGGMGAAFGGGSATVFGGRGAGTFLGKVTAACAGIFMLTSLFLAYQASHTRSVVRADYVPPAAPSTPAPPSPLQLPAPGGTAPAQPAPAAPAPASK